MFWYLFTFIFSYVNVNCNKHIVFEKIKFQSNSTNRDQMYQRNWPLLVVFWEIVCSTTSCLRFPVALQMSHSSVFLIHLGFLSIVLPVSQVMNNLYVDSTWVTDKQGHACDWRKHRSTGSPNPDNTTALQLQGSNSQLDVTFWEPWSETWIVDVILWYMLLLEAR